MSRLLSHRAIRFVGHGRRVLGPGASAPLPWSPVRKQNDLFLSGPKNGFRVFSAGVYTGLILSLILVLMAWYGIVQKPLLSGPR